MMHSEQSLFFIEQHLHDAPTQLLLKYGTEKAEWIAQIEARQKAKDKLPSWYRQPLVWFPPNVSVEQSSSEWTAQYKAQIIARSHTPTLIDATGGMGVDSSFFAKVCQKVVYIEQNKALANISRYNFEVLGLKNIECINQDSIAFLQNATQPADWLYLDPARRTTEQRRVFHLSDCQPDVVQLWPFLRQKACRILLKVSPLLDISQVLQLLPYVTEVHVVAFENECKELLLESEQLESKSMKPLTVYTINLKKNGSTEIFNFEWEREASAEVQYSQPLSYIYEPNAAILKAGAFKSLGQSMGLYKIAPHSHLYTSHEWRNDFPGRTFKIISIQKADNKDIKDYLKDGKANLTLRNFPGTTEQLRKKLKLKDGGDVYLLATTLHNGDKRILICEKA